MIELGADHRFIAERYGGREQADLSIANEGDLDLLATGEPAAIGHVDTQPFLREVLGHAVNFTAVGTHNPDRQIGAYPRLGANLPGFAGDGHRCAGDDDVVDRPGQVDQHGDEGIACTPDQFVSTEAQAGQVQQQQDDVGTGQLPFEVFLVDDPAFVGHVETTELGIHQGHQHRPHDVPGQYRLVDLVPERVTESTLNA
ncbi:hypothetical protein D3C85_1228510 [compost metagenome]